MDVKALADGIEAVWQNERLRLEMIQKGLERARFYSRRTVGQELVNVYESVLAEDSHDPR